MATTDTDKDSLQEHRISSLMRLGFSEVQSTVLADSYYRVHNVTGSKGVKKSYSIRVDWHYCRKLLEAGATHQQVVSILA
jgi:hypothetical protein